MTKTYTTKSGDMWDLIAKNILGGEEHKTVLIKYNPEYTSTYIFPAGKVLRIPQVKSTTAPPLPPWKAGRV